MPMDVLDHDDGVVDHEADGDARTAHRHQIDGAAREVQDEKRADDRQRQRRRRDERRRQSRRKASSTNTASRPPMTMASARCARLGHERRRSYTFEMRMAGGSDRAFSRSVCSTPVAMARMLPRICRAMTDDGAAGRCR
jgi:hypothetical protein